MVSSWMSLFVALSQIILFLDSSSSESSSFNRAPGIPGVSQKVGKTHQCCSDNYFLSNHNNEFVEYKDNPFRRQIAHDNCSEVHDMYVSFPRNSSGRLDIFRSRRTPSSANPRIIVGDNSQDETPMTASSPVQGRFRRVIASPRSELNCTEYRSGGDMMFPDQPWMDGRFGINQSHGLHIRDPDSIVGGRDAKLGEFPHVVALGKVNEEGQFSLHCGGTLISSRWVLTAAHCTHGPAGGVTTARLGILHMNDTNGLTIRIRRTVRHPTYRPPAMYADIALLELKRSVSFNRLINPACLHQPHHNIPTTAWISGWGATEFGGEESNTLQGAELQIVDNVECATKYNHSRPVPDGVVSSMICAGAPRNNWQQDTCQGDSGGPLQILSWTYPSVYQIVGITSFGAGCAFVDSPGVYTRVSHYIDWIVDIVSPQGN